VQQFHIKHDMLLSYHFLCFIVHQDFLKSIHNIKSGIPRPHHGCDLVTTFGNFLIKGEASPWKHNVGIPKSQCWAEIVFAITNKCDNIVLETGRSAMFVEDLTFAHVGGTHTAPVLPVIRRQLQTARVIKC